MMMKRGLIVALYFAVAPSVFAEQIPTQRLLKIAEYTTKMQILDEPNPQEITQRLAELMVGNTHDHEAIQKFTDPIPNQGIANYLRTENLKGLSETEAKLMKPILEKEIQQTSTMFRSCRIHQNIQKIQQHYLVEINCQVPQPTTTELAEFQQLLNEHKPATAALEKIFYLDAKQKILAKTQYQNFKSTLLVEIAENGVLRAAIENDAHFPNIVIDQRDNALTFRKSAP